MVAVMMLVVVKASSVRRPWPRRVSTPMAAPSGIASTTAVRKASTARASVAGSRWATTSVTGSCEASEVPRSPVSSPFR
ncbi:hypothetical protein LUX32_10155 [Actinomadura madurae]|nr:hypothetical protein [Actinomadura madurae]MCP9977960.1 hypothetical protein [Actinomadura madurae]